MYELYTATHSGKQFARYTKQGKEVRMAEAKTSLQEGLSAQDKGDLRKAEECFMRAADRLFLSKRPIGFYLIPIQTDLDSKYLERNTATMTELSHGLKLLHKQCDYDTENIQCDADTKKKLCDDDTKNKLDDTTPILCVRLYNIYNKDNYSITPMYVYAILFDKQKQDECVEALQRQQAQTS